MKRLLLLIGLALGQTYDPLTGEEVSNQSITEEKSILNKHNLSVGMFDDRTGISVIGYTYNLKQTKMDEYFIGAGTVFLAMTGTVGWKHFYKKSRLSIASVVCGQWFFPYYVVHQNLNFSEIYWGVYNGEPQITASITLEYNLAKWVQIKAGGVLGWLDGGFECGAGLSGLPFASLNFSF
jgi:hypothetical protein